MKRMKAKRLLMMLVMFASVAAQAQGYDDDCRDMLRRIKRTYAERGEEDALRQIELLCGSCNASICSEARAWLREQKNKKFTKPVETFTVKGVEFKMIRVEGGTFSMGATSEQGEDASDYEYPVHSVTLSDYYIGETEVTQELWQAVMGSNPSWFKGNNQRPVESVSYYDCQKFIEKLNSLTGKQFRLPTEAEWEYAARGGKHSKDYVYKYSGSNNADEVAWYWQNSGDKYLSGKRDWDKVENNNCKTHPVKTKKANELGLYDMSGNVEEWCNDWSGSYQSYSQTNPTGPSTGEFRILRGGSWVYGDGDVRVSDRNGNNPYIPNSYHGLRLAL